MDYITALLAIVGVLVAVTNIIVQVVKKVTWDKIPTNLLALIVSMALTLAAFFAWAAVAGFPILGYDILGAVVVGIMVAYAAMFGFDKLKEILDKLRTNK
jgi:hypothetical protein